MIKKLMIGTAIAGAITSTGMGLMSNHNISINHKTEIAKPTNFMTLQPYPDGAEFAGGENNGYVWGLVEDPYYAHEAFAENYNQTVCSGWVQAGGGQAYAQVATTWAPGSNQSWFNLDN